MGRGAGARRRRDGVGGGRVRYVARVHRADVLLRVRGRKGSGFEEQAVPEPEARQRQRVRSGWVWTAGYSRLPRIYIAYKNSSCAILPSTTVYTATSVNWIRSPETLLVHSKEYHTANFSGLTNSPVTEALWTSLSFSQPTFLARTASLPSNSRSLSLYSV